MPARELVIPGEGEVVALCLDQFEHWNVTFCSLSIHYALLRGIKYRLQGLFPRSSASGFSTGAA